MFFFNGIKIENFKSLKNLTEFQFAPITVLTGSNSSGKSTVYQALSFLNSALFYNFENKRVDSNEYDKRIISLFEPVPYTNFIQENRVFKHLLNRESNSDTLTFEIPFILESYSNEVVAKIDFKLLNEPIGLCQLCNILIYDKKTDEELIKYYKDGNKVKAKFNFEVLYIDLVIRRDNFEKLKKIIKNHIIDIYKNLQDEDIQPVDIVKYINVQPDFIDSSKELMGDSFELNHISINHPVNDIDDDYDFDIKIHDKLIFYIQFKGSSFGNFYSLKRQINFFNRNVKELGYLIKIDKFEIIDKTNLSAIRNIDIKHINVDEYYILNRLSNKVFEFDSENATNFLNDVTKFILKELNIETPNALNFDEQKLRKKIISTSFIKFIDTYILLNIIKSFSYVSKINYIGISESRLNRNIDFIDSNYDYIIDFYLEQNSHKYSKNICFINKWVEKFNIGKNITFKKNDTDFFSLFIDGERNISDEGRGVKQIIALLFKIQMYIDKFGFFHRSKLIFIEEPETYLHPAYQSLLAELIYDAYTEFRLQFIVETHSEYFVRKLQYLVADTKALPEDINIYYFNNTQDNDEKTYQITLDEYGTLSRNFGKGFYDESSSLNLSLYLRTKNDYN